MTSPNHIAIIMDGNGRWARRKYKNRISGHIEGVKTINPIINYCIKNKIKVLSLYALSYDNFKKRNKKEIVNIFKILKKYLSENLNNFIKKNIFLNFIGELNELPSSINYLLKNTIKETKNKKNSLIVNIAFNYSSKKEILNSIKNLKKKNIKLTSDNFSKFLYTHPFNDPEILIRTGSYQRLSDFFLWQNSYSEMFFLKKLWPEFSTTDLKKIILKYKKIKRNFGS